MIDPNTGRLTDVRMEYEDGTLIIIAGDQTYIKDGVFEAIKEGRGINPDFFLNNFIAVATQNIRDKGKIIAKEQFSEEFQRDVIVVDVIQKHVHVHAIIDIDSKRPIKLSIPRTSYHGEILDRTELIEYDVDLPEGFLEI